MSEHDVWSILAACKLVNSRSPVDKDFVIVVQYLTRYQLDVILNSNKHHEWYKRAVENELLERALGAKRKDINEHRKIRRVRL